MRVGGRVEGGEWAAAVLPFVAGAAPLDSTSG